MGCELDCDIVPIFINRRSGPTAGVTGKRGTWREKPPDAESAPAPHALCGGWGLIPESVGKGPHLSGARGVRFRFRHPKAILG